MKELKWICSNCGTLNQKSSCTECKQAFSNHPVDFPVMTTVDQNNVESEEVSWVSDSDGINQESNFRDHILNMLMSVISIIGCMITITFVGLIIWIVVIAYYRARYGH